MRAKRARFYDGIALCTAILVIVIDQWTKNLVANNLALGSEVPFPFVGRYLVVQYIRNNGAAFSMFNTGSGSLILAVLISVAICVVVYMYVRSMNTGPLFYKLVLGLIIGGASGNLLDRLMHGGYVVDFVSFRIPEIQFYFAIFNVADACISIGVVLLFLYVLFGGGGNRVPQREQGHEEEAASVETTHVTTTQSGVLHTTEQDA